MASDSLFRSMMRTSAPGAVIVIRFLAGGVFFIEGLKKFLFVEQWGAGRFARIGIPVPAFTGPFVGVVEVVCGVLLLLGLLTRVGAIVLLINISVAIASTKIPDPDQERVLRDGGPGADGLLHAHEPGLPGNSRGREMVAGFGIVEQAAPAARGRAGASRRVTRIAPRPNTSRTASLSSLTLPNADNGRRLWPRREPCRASRAG